MRSLSTLGLAMCAHSSNVLLPGTVVWTYSKDVRSAMASSVSPDYPVGALQDVGSAVSARDQGVKLLSASALYSRSKVYILVKYGC